MKLFLISAAAAAFALASPALAQDDHGHSDHNRGASHTTPAKPEKESKPADRTDRADVKARADRTDAKVRADRTTPATTTKKPDATWRDSNGRVKTTASPGAVYNNAVRNDARNDNRRDNARDNNRKNNDRNNNWNGNNNRRTDNNNNNRRNWQGKFNRRNVTAQHHYRYRGNSWRWPNGYHYQRWTFGMTLPSLFWASDYWINDYSDYGLAYPPPGTVWVRYGDDAVLIDRDSGEILEVVYGQFY